MEQIKKDEYIAPYIIVQGSRFKNFWDLVNMFLLFYTATYMPFEIAFIDDYSDARTAFEWIINTLFLIDIVLTFFT